MVDRAPMAALVLTLHEIRDKGRRNVRFDLGGVWLAEAFADTELTPLADLPEATEKVDLDEGEATAAPSPERSVTLVAQTTGTSLLVQGTLDVRVLAPCARCNEPVAVHVHEAFTHLLTPLAERGELPEEIELTPEDLERDYFGGDEIALDSVVREQILLEVPIRPVCEGGCADEAVRRILDGGDDEEMPQKAGPLAGLLALKDKLEEK